MTYFEDLSVYAYFLPTNGDNAAKNVGWLDHSHVYPTEQPSPVFLELLWEYCRINVNPTRGLHRCDLCGRRTPAYVRGTTQLLLGSAEIRVFSASGEVLAAPNLIYHYVSDHSYRPPSEFVRAVMEGPRPFSNEYMHMIRLNGIAWRENPVVSGEVEQFKFVRTANGIVKVKE